MLIVLKKSTIKCDEFYCNCIPVAIHGLFMSYCNNHMVQLSKISKEFKNRFKTDILNVIPEFIDDLYVSENKLSYIYQLDKNLKDSNGNKYIDMFDFINSGSLTSKGLDVYKYINNMIHKNFKSIYDSYVYKRLSGE